MSFIPSAFKNFFECIIYLLHFHQSTIHFATQIALYKLYCCKMYNKIVMEPDLKGELASLGSDLAF